jgi:hypothetical protein
MHEERQAILSALTARKNTAVKEFARGAQRARADDLPRRILFNQHLRRACRMLDQKTAIVRQQDEGRGSAVCCLWRAPSFMTSRAEKAPRT